MKAPFSKHGHRTHLEIKKRITNGPGWEGQSLYIYNGIYMYTYTHTHKYIYIYMCIYIIKYLYIHNIYIYIYIYIYICMYVWG